MAEFISTTSQSLTNVGDSVTFNSTVVCGNCNIKHREGSGLIKIRGSESCSNRARYRITFNANVSGIASNIQLAVYQDSEELNETLMSVVPATTTDVWSVNANTEIYVDCNCSTISVKTLTAGITVDTASIIITKII